MRILTIAKELGPGGTERAAQNCTRAYRAAGHEVAVLGIDKGGSRAEAMQAEGIPVWIGGYSPAEVDAAVLQAVAWQPQFVHIHRTGHADAVSASALRRLREAAANRLPVIETNHFSRSDRTDDRRLIDLHIHMSEWCLWKWQQYSKGLRPAPFGVVLPHLIDTTAFGRVSQPQRASRREALGIPSGAFAFGRLGQPFGAGWSRMVFDAFERFAPAHPDAVLVVIGLPEMYRARIAALPEAIRARVLDRPFVHGDAALRESYSALDCFLHAKQIGESFGYVLIESMLCECPVISLSTPARDNSQLEVVGHERGGLMVTDTDSMVQAMERMHADESLRRRLAAGGARWVRENYAWEVVAPRLLRLVELTASTNDPVALRERLRADGFVTSVSSQRVDQLMSNVMGRNRAMTRLAMRLGHQPMLYRGFVAAKRVVTRYRG